MKNEDDGDTNCNLCSWNGSQKLGRKPGGIKNQRETRLSRLQHCWDLTLTLWPINSCVLTSLLLPHLLSSLTDSLPWIPWIYATQKLILDSCKMVEKQSEAFHTFLWHFFPSLKHNFIAYRSSKVSDCIFEIHQVWQSGFSRVYSNCCCSCSFEGEIIKIGQSSHKMYSSTIHNYQVSTTILNAHTKKVWKLIVFTLYVNNNNNNNNNSSREKLKLF